jgi:hypothetical protein
VVLSGPPINYGLVPQMTQRVFTRISWLTLHEEVIVVYAENNMKPIRTFFGQNALLVNVKAYGTYTYQCVLGG